MIMTHGTIELDLEEGGLATIWLDRPECLNAISFEMIADLHEALDCLARDLGQRVVVISGRGRAFCSGIDLRHDIEEWPEPLGPVQRRFRQQQRLSEIILKLREIPQPVIAAVRGAAVGGGLALAAAADIRVADKTARFSAAFIRVGLSGGDLGVSWTLPRLIGASRAAELLLTGRFLEADEASRIGFLSRLVAAGDHLKVARAIGAQILNHAPLGVRMTKALLDASMASSSLRSHVELEDRTQALCALTGDFDEGMSAFREGRSPAYGDG